MKNIKFIFSFLLFFLFLAVLSGCENETYAIPHAFVTIDINPSVEIMTGEDGLVEEVNALNDDAELLLFETDFEGKDLGEVLDSIIELGAELGYIDPELENEIIVTAEADDEEKTEDLERKIIARIQKFIRKKTIKMKIIRAREAASEELLQKAAELGISVGKLKLAYFAVSLSQDLSLEEAAKMSVRDLNAIVKETRREMKFLKEEFKDLYFEIKEELRTCLFIERARLINEYIQAAPDEVFANFMTEFVDAEAIRTAYQAYWNELSAYEPEKASIPDALKKAKQELEEQIKELLNNGSMKEKREAFINLKEQLREIKEQIKEAVGAEGGFRGLGNMRFRHLRELNKIREKYAGVFLELGIDLDELEEFVLEKIKEEFTEIQERLTNEFQKKREELQDRAREHQEFLKKEREMLRETRKKGKNKGRD